MPHTERPGSSADDRGGLLIPVLPTEDGPPDAGTVVAWHLALSNLLGAEVPHDLLALWLFPEQGNVLLLAPAELEEDHLVLPVPSPRLAQHQLFELEERIRRARYGSVVAVPIRGEIRDLGLALFAALRPGAYGVPQALRLHEVLRDLIPTFEGLSAAPPMPTASSAPGTTHDLQAFVAQAASESRSGPELLRLLSGALLTVIPHERIDIAIPGVGSGTWALLSGRPEGQRWGGGGSESAVQVSATVDGLLEAGGEDGMLMIPELGTSDAWPTYVPTRATQRVRSVIGVQLSVVDATPAWLLLGGPRSGMFGEPDRETLRLIAPIVALRVHGLRAALTTEVGRAHLSTLQASQPRVARMVSLLAATEHWGEASRAFADEVSSALGYRAVRFALRLGSDRLITLDPGDPRPITGLEPSVEDFSVIGPVVAGRAPFQVYGENGENLAVPLRLAGRAVGALELLGGAQGAAGHPVTEAQQLADVLAPHLELLRRTALPDPVEEQSKPAPDQPEVHR